MEVDIINVMNAAGDRVQMVVPEEVATLFLQFEGHIQYEEVGDTLVWMKEAWDNPTSGAFSLDKSMILACLVDPKEVDKEELWNELLHRDLGIDTVTKTVDAQCRKDANDRMEQRFTYPPVPEEFGEDLVRMDEAEVDAVISVSKGFIQWYTNPWVWGQR